MVLRLKPGTVIPRPVLRPVLCGTRRVGGRESGHRRSRPITMTPLVEALAITGFAGVMTVAAFEDFRRMVIPNLLPIVLCVLWPLYFAAAPSLYGALAAIGCAAAVFFAGAILFARGWLGGGDV